MTDLATTQSWFQNLIVADPDVLAKSATSIEQAIKSSYGLDAHRRIEIYRSMYPLRMVEAMGIDYPGVKHAMGQRSFEAAVMDYVRVHPSTSWTLDHLGSRFPGYLLQRTDLPNRSFLCELARLEWALCEVFHALACKESPSWLEIDPCLWGEVSLIPAETSRVFKFSYPVSHYLGLVGQGLEPDIPRRGDECLLVCRPLDSMRRIPLVPFAYDLLSDLFDGQTLGAALVRMTRRHPDVQGEALRQAFAKWSAQKIFQGYRFHNDRTVAEEKGNL